MSILCITITRTDAGCQSTDASGCSRAWRTDAPDPLMQSDGRRQPLWTDYAFQLYAETGAAGWAPSRLRHDDREMSP